MGSIKKFSKEVQVRLTGEEMVAMHFQIASGEWDVGSAIARACVNKVEETAEKHAELKGLNFDLYKVVPGKGEFVVYLHITEEGLGAEERLMRMVE